MTRFAFFRSSSSFVLRPVKKYVKKIVVKVITFRVVENGGKIVYEAVLRKEDMHHNRVNQLIDTKDIKHFVRRSVIAGVNPEQIVNEVVFYELGNSKPENVTHLQIFNGDFTSRMISKISSNKIAKLKFDYYHSISQNEMGCINPRRPYHSLDINSPIPTFSYPVKYCDPKTVEYVSSKEFASIGMALKKFLNKEILSVEKGTSYPKERLQNNLMIETQGLQPKASIRREFWVSVESNPISFEKNYSLIGQQGIPITCFFVVVFLITVAFLKKIILFFFTKSSLFKNK